MLAAHQRPPASRTSYGVVASTPSPRGRDAEPDAANGPSSALTGAPVGGKLFLLGGEAIVSAASLGYNHGPWQWYNIRSTITQSPGDKRGSPHHIWDTTSMANPSPAARGGAVALAVGLPRLI
jgi:hypothetical protein